MGKQGKKAGGHRQKASRREAFNSHEEVDHETSLYSQSANGGQEDPIDSSVSKLSLSDQSGEEDVQEDDRNAINSSHNIIPSKFCLYQQSVQSPKGDISYLLKFFLNYVGGRLPLHLQEDFCGTALLSTEWLRSDSRRTAVGLDLDDEALNWCIENNLYQIGAEDNARISLFHGNVLNPLESQLLVFSENQLSKEETIKHEEDDKKEGLVLMKDMKLPARDIVCAFNYSCCCLHNRRELISYFKHALFSLSKKSGIFVMDLYGGTSSECELKLQRKFPNFMYTWEQAEFDIITRQTRISLHYRLKKQKKKIENAFSYSWRLWTLPEIKECLEEAGFRSVHFWMREMPASDEIKSIEGFGSGRDVKYEEVVSFEQRDSWNAYIVGVA
ncbi:uncharacterized protein LOC124936013 [Impatiens glandulifera]|uniref:uncharacterized protein LOC124936013 n=1 Tax=Impatiens glandulifera TaxID=253017 RepID=UPI001FB18BDE|nr:uncharacterized protein LOC124936013 [Impatiens glandulifera]